MASCVLLILSLLQGCGMRNVKRTESSSGSNESPQSTTSNGSMGGKFSISPDGKSTFEMPIKVPPGTAGMQPHLSLSYNSSGGNGILGMGWTLDGLSIIERTGATYNQDGYKGGVDYLTSDRLMLDGDRLTMVGECKQGNAPAYYCPNASYHTEKESWVKVQFTELESFGTNIPFCK